MAKEIKGAAIETFDLTKQYDGKGGCLNIRLNVQKGKIFGFLGPNGAGKSTLVKTLVGLLKPTSGSAKILGKPLDDWKIRAKIGYLPETFRYQGWMTGLEVLNFHAELYKIKNSASRIEELLDLVRLRGHERKRISSYSKGMQQRLGLAAALISDPELLFLDEPTSALDPVGRVEVREIIKQLKNQGKTVFLNSHLLSEVEMLCDEVAIINKGRIISQWKMSELLNRGHIIQVKVGNLSKNLLRGLSSIVEDIDVNEDILYVKVKSEEQIPDIAKTIISSGTQLFELKPYNSSLEDIFVNLIKAGEQI